MIFQTKCTINFINKRSVINDKKVKKSNTKKLKNRIDNFNLPKIPVIKNIKEIKNLQGYHFHFACDLEGIKSDFTTPRRQLVEIAKDIYKDNKHQNSFSYCEACPFDGYISWRLSTMSNIKQYTIEYIEKNIEKMKIIAKIFDYKIETFTGCVESYNNKMFDVFSMLGWSSQAHNKKRYL